MGQQAPQIPADPSRSRSGENRLKPCPTYPSGSLVRAHNPKVAGSNPAPAISRKPRKCGVFVCLRLQTTECKMAHGQALGQGELWERSLSDPCAGPRVHLLSPPTRQTKSAPGCGNSRRHKTFGITISENLHYVIERDVVPLIEGAQVEKPRNAWSCGCRGISCFMSTRRLPERSMSASSASTPPRSSLNSSPRTRPSWRSSSADEGRHRGCCRVCALIRLRFARCRDDSGGCLVPRLPCPLSDG